MEPRQPQQQGARTVHGPIPDAPQVHCALKVTTRRVPLPPEDEHLAAVTQREHELQLIPYPLGQRERTRNVPPALRKRACVHVDGAKVVQGPELSAELPRRLRPRQRVLQYLLRLLCPPQVKQRAGTALLG